MAIFSTFTARAGKDAEVKFLPSGEAILEVNAVTDYYDSKKKEKVGQWMRVSMFGKRGESVAKYLTKGSTFTVSGQLHVAEYDKKDGSRGYSLEVRASEIELVGGKPKGERSEVSGGAEIGSNTVAGNLGVTAADASF